MLLLIILSKNSNLSPQLPRLFQLTKLNWRHLMLLRRLEFRLVGFHSKQTFQNFVKNRFNPQIIGKDTGVLVSLVNIMVQGHRLYLQSKPKMLLNQQCQLLTAQNQFHMTKSGNLRLLMVLSWIIVHYQYIFLQDIKIFIEHL